MLFTFFFTISGSLTWASLAHSWCSVGLGGLMLLLCSFFCNHELRAGEDCAEITEIKSGLHHSTEVVTYYTTNSSWGVTCADTHALGGLILRVGTQLSFRASSFCALSSEKACPVTSPNGTNLKREILWAGEGLSGNIIDTPSRKKFVEE